jgi:hypothetical protein
LTKKEIKHESFPLSLTVKHDVCGVGGKKIENLDIFSLWLLPDSVRATLPLRPPTERGKRLINHMPITVGILRD